jgi:N-acyl-D-aspartate/D-glutamate deacylase
VPEIRDALDVFGEPRWASTVLAGYNYNGPSKGSFAWRRLGGVRRVASGRKRFVLTARGEERGHLMLDCVVRNGDIIDGTGALRWRGDVGIKDGRIVEIGEISTEAARVIDATGRVVSPGFIDIHTHYDAQIFWDPALTPSPFHGVTTVVAGNCGLTLAPIADENADYTLKLLGRVEGVPISSLLEGVPWGSWHTFGEYLKFHEGRLTINTALLVGHNALRLTVMGSDMRREATAGELAELVALLEECLAAGGIGFSTSLTTYHSDGEGAPVPSRYASREELLTLCATVRRYPGTILQVTGGLTPFTDEEMALMADMSIAADRPINWNSLMVSKNTREVVEHNLAMSDYAAARGATVLALTFAIAPTTRLSFVSGVVLDAIPGWSSVFEERDLSKRCDMLTNPVTRRLLAEGAESATSMKAFVDWETHIVGETFSAANAGLEGRTFGDVARERGQDPFDCLLDIVVADDLRTVVVTKANGDDAESWKLRAEVFRDPRVLIGASDAGAHLDMIDAFAYTTDVLGRSVRDRKLFSLEEGVRLLTDVPALAYGLGGRGRIEVGHHADIVVFDPDGIGQGAVHLRDDLPGGASRLYMVAEGIDHVLVAGREVVRGTELTGEQPGSILRSGHDTYTVRADYLPSRLRQS